jgi:hypothetical protein
MTLKLNGSSSGSVSIDAPASTTGGADRTLTLPDDASNGVVKTSTYPSSIQVLEQFYTPCDGSTIATSAGNVTVQNVTGVMTNTTSYADATGSVITYTPPTGTTQVIYEYEFLFDVVDNFNIGHFKAFIGGTEITNARFTQGADDRLETRVHFKWGINIGGSTTAATGRQASWTSGKELKVQCRDYGTGDEMKLHQTHYWDGSTSDQFSQPCIGITAIGAA